MKTPHIPQPKVHDSAVIAPGSHIYGDVTIDSDVFVLFGAVIRAELDRIVIGSETNIQDNCVFHCDENIPALIGRRVTVGHNAVIHGAEIGDRALIGIGAMALNRSSVGEGAWLAAGSVLPEGKTIPAWTLAMGTPARSVRELTDDEVAHADEGVDHYLELAAAYREIFG
ncbi:MAG TPA: gamma carbonic anhydrase family protein [Acidimicrobiia bacterium]|nr:gamma carbonic anhydrase family protein [Acidimicrobiia bacterium]